MASEAESARRQAARFLAMAKEAREKGNLSLAELLTDAATAAFDKAEEAEAEAAAPPPSIAEPQQPAQQQQQVQPDQDPENNE